MGRRARQQIRASATVMVLIFSDVGQMREIGECAHHGIGLVAAKFFQQAVKISAGLEVGFAPEAHGGLPNRLHHLEYRLAFLLPNDLAEQATQQANIFPQWGVLVVGFRRACKRRSSKRHRSLSRAQRRAAGGSRGDRMRRG